MDKMLYKVILVDYMEFERVVYAKASTPEKAIELAKQTLHTQWPDRDWRLRSMEWLDEASLMEEKDA